MKLKLNNIEMYVDMDKCERDDPCAYDHTCRIHKLRWFLCKVGAIAIPATETDGKGSQ